MVELVKYKIFYLLLACMVYKIIRNLDKHIALPNSGCIVLLLRYSTLKNKGLSAENIQFISEITEEGIREAESKAVFEAEKLSEQSRIVPPEQRKTPKADKPEPRSDITDGLKTLDESFANLIFSSSQQG